MVSAIRRSSRTRQAGAATLLALIAAAATAGSEELLRIQSISDNVGNVDGLGGSQGIAMAPDGRHVYATGSFDDAIVTLPDFNGDLVVNFPDLLTMQVAFFSTPASPNWDEDVDLDGNGIVNFSDLFIMQAFFFGAPGP